jgi:hypothetical protein
MLLCFAKKIVFLHQRVHLNHLKKKKKNKISFATINYKSKRKKVIWLAQKGSLLVKTIPHSCTFSICLDSLLGALFEFFADVALGKISAGVFLR